MLKAIDLAKFFIKQDAKSFDNSFDGNMKLQKLLFFADMIHLANYDEQLFDDEIRAYAKGCVVEDVRTHYRLFYSDLYSDSLKFEPNFTESQFQTIKKTIEIFGGLSAKSLSDLSHEFNFWKAHYDDSINPDGTYDQNKNVIPVSEMREEKEKMINLLSVQSSTMHSGDTINGIKFFFDSELDLTEELYNYLYEFSKSPEAEDEVYSVYLDNNELVVY